MLRFLRIRNLAVIEAIEVEFEPGFNVLTGETGAGKSILVEAVGLLLGARASADLVRTGEAQATIEAIFEEREGRELIVRREISSQGRSRFEGMSAAIAWLRANDVHSFHAHIHPDHAASKAVAARLDFEPTGSIRNGEVCWELPARCHN